MAHHRFRRARDDLYAARQRDPMAQGGGEAGRKTIKTIWGGPCRARLGLPAAAPALSPRLPVSLCHLLRLLPRDEPQRREAAIGIAGGALLGREHVVALPWDLERRHLHGR